MSADGFMIMIENDNDVYNVYNDDDGDAADDDDNNDDETIMMICIYIHFLFFVFLTRILVINKFFFKGPSYNKKRMFMWLLAKPLPVADRIALENVKTLSYMSRVFILI